MGSGRETLALWLHVDIGDPHQVKRKHDLDLLLSMQLLQQDHTYS